MTTAQRVDRVADRAVINEVSLSSSGILRLTATDPRLYVLMAAAEAMDLQPDWKVPSFVWALVVHGRAHEGEEDLAEGTAGARAAGGLSGGWMVQCQWDRRSMAPTNPPPPPSSPRNPTLPHLLAAQPSILANINFQDLQPLVSWIAVLRPFMR